MAGRIGTNGFGILGWAGWRLRIPVDWRPLRVEGEWGKGAMIVGTGEEAAMQVKWWRPESRRFDAERWLHKRVASVLGNVDPDAESPEGFPFCSLLPDYTTKDDVEGLLWLGYSPAGGVAVEIVAGGDALKKTVKTVRRRVIPSLRSSAAGDATRWSIYGASFESPPSFCLTDRRLLLGDIAVRLSSSGGRRLVLRQVYPATLALARRKMPNWMDFPPFPERRRFRASGSDQDWSVNCYGRRLRGFRRLGRKAFPFPLGVFAPRFSYLAVAHDRELDRLLLVEYDARREESDVVVSRLVASMNWAHFDAEGST
jgi:hypothetical protein